MNRTQRGRLKNQPVALVELPAFFARRRVEEVRRAKENPSFLWEATGSMRIARNPDSKGGRLFDVNFCIRFHKRVELGNGVVGDGFFDDGFDRLRFRFGGGFVGAEFRPDDERETNDEEEEHGGEDILNALGGALKFAPDEDAPDRGHERRALPQAVGDGGGSDSRRDDVERHADRPDKAADPAPEVIPERAFPERALLHGLADERLAHEDRHNDAVAQEDADREEHVRGVRGEFPRFENRALDGEIRERDGTQNVAVLHER